MSPRLIELADMRQQSWRQSRMIGANEFRYDEAARFRRLETTD